MTTRFYYVAKDETGNLHRASLSAENRNDALAALRKKNLTVVDLQSSDTSQSSARKKPAKKATKPMFSFGMVKDEEIAIFCRQLAISINAGVPLRESLESIVEDMDNPMFAKVLHHIIQQIHDGETFSDSLRKHERIFSPLFVSLVRAAEEAGSMPQTLEHLSYYLERSVKLKRKIKSITAYPIFVAIFFCIVCAIMTIFVLPQFQDVFSGFDADLPVLTVTVFAINRVLIDNSALILGAVVLILVLINLYGRTASGRLVLDSLKLRVPFIGTCLKKYAVARFCRNLSIMLKGGVPVTTSMEITSNVSGNKVLERSLLAAREKIIAGKDISTSLSEESDMPRLVVRMIDVGEESGKLPEVLEKISEIYEDQVEGAITTAAALFEPLIIVFFGCIILVLVLAIYMPIFTVAGHVN